MIVLDPVCGPSQPGCRCPARPCDEGFTPAGLTTIGQPALEKGTAAFNILRSGGTEHVLLPHELIVRASTGRDP